MQSKATKNKQPDFGTFKTQMKERAQLKKEGESTPKLGKQSKEKKGGKKKRKG